MAQVMPDIFDVPDAGQSGEFSIYARGADVYLAVIANKGDGGRLMLRRVGGGLAQDLNLGPLGVTGALSVRLDGASGTLIAYVKRVLDTDGQDRGRRVITPIDTGIRLGDAPQPQPAPVPTPAPQPTPAPTPLDGQVLGKLDQLVKMLDDDWNAAMKPTVLATARIEQALGELSRVLADLPAAVWDVPPRPDHDGLPESLRSGTRHQEDGTWQLVRDLRTLLNDPTFPESDPLAPPTG